MDTGGKPTDHFAAICQGLRQEVDQEMGAILQKQHKFLLNPLHQVVRAQQEINSTTIVVNHQLTDSKKSFL